LSKQLWNGIHVNSGDITKSKSKLNYALKMFFETIATDDEKRLVTKARLSGLHSDSSQKRSPDEQELLMATFKIASDLDRYVQALFAEAFVHVNDKAKQNKVKMFPVPGTFAQVRSPTDGIMVLNCNSIAKARDALT
jgi:hypothetical protein